MSYHSRHSSEPLSALGTCNEDGTVTFNIADGTAKVTLYADTEATQLLDCNDSNNKLSQIRKVKALGSYAGTTRVLEVAVAGTSGECEFVSAIGACKNEAGDTADCYLKLGTVNVDVELSLTVNKVCYDKKGHNYYAVGYSGGEKGVFPS